MDISLIIILSILASVAAAGGFFWLKRRKGKEEAVALLQEVSRAIQLNNSELKKYPVPSLNGHYHTFPFVLECAQKGPNIVWRVHSELASPVDGRIAIHSEGRHGRMRELYGMEVVITGDDVFDGRFVMAATDEGFAKRVFTPYVRSRFLALSLPVFTIDLRGKEIYAECTTGMPVRRQCGGGEPIAPLIPVIALLFEFCDRLS